MTGEPVFQVSLPGQPDAEDALGLWRSAPAAVAAAMPPVDAGSIWLANLPDDPDSADALLLAQRRRVGALSRALPAAPLYLQADLARMANPENGEVSFALNQAGPEAPMNILAGALQYRFPEHAVSFGLLDAFKPDRREVEESAGLFERFTRQVRQSVDGFAQVETVIGGRKLGRSHAAWSGDLETWWAVDGLPDERRRHEEVLAQAFATRQHWLRFFLLVAGGIPRVAGALAAGPFSPVAIWATWNYFRQVIRAYRQAVQPPGLPADPV